MPSLAARVLRLYSRRTIRLQDPASLDALVAHLRRTMGNPPPLPTLLPPSVRLARFNGDGFAGDWLQVKSARLAVLYLHGGGFITGVTRTYHPLCSRLATELQADVFLPEYRLAPEHPFPAAVDDAYASYRLLLARGWRPEHIVFAGDSAGGGLALATLLKARDAGDPLPACALLFSPFADMTATATSHATNDDTDPMLSERMLAIAETVYVRDPADFRHPYASPVYGDFTGLPPLFVTVDEEECLRDDAYEVVDRAKAARVPVTLVARRGVIHVWPIFWPLLPEAREDMRKAVRFVRGATGMRAGMVRLPGH